MSTQAEPLLAGHAENARADMTYREAICLALHHALAEDESVLLMGEDVASDGGVFKTNVGLPSRFPDRVLNTPICENAFVGAALGMAIVGLRPVVEIMFSDFLPTAADAIVEELPKIRFMSGGQCTVPVTIRSIGGGGGRFGTQHSATGESWFMALPGLKVATAGTPAGAYAVLRAAIRLNDPVLVIEHKGLYGRTGTVATGPDALSLVGRASVERPGNDVTIVSTLLMTDRALAASELLAERAIDAEIIDLRWLRPLDYNAVRESVTRTGRLLVVEEQPHAAGWGATLISRLACDGSALKAPPAALSLPDDVLVPYAPPLEDAVIPSIDRIADAAYALCAA